MRKRKRVYAVAAAWGLMLLLSVGGNVSAEDALDETIILEETETITEKEILQSETFHSEPTQSYPKQCCRRLRFWKQRA